MSGPAVPESAFGIRHAMPLENFIGTAQDVMRGLYPEETEEQKKAAARQREQGLAVAQGTARLMGDADFVALLEHLCDVTVRQVKFVIAPGVDPMQSLLVGAKREGQQELVFTILALIAAGRDERPPQREGVK